MTTLADRWLRPRSARTQFPPYDLGDPTIVGQAEARTSTLARIYHKGHEQAWDGRTVMDELIAKHGEIRFPADKREAFERIAAVLLWGELAAWSISADLALKLEDTPAKMAASSQVFDEARHFYVLREYMWRAGLRVNRLGGWSRRLLVELLETDNLLYKVVGMQLLVESTAVVMFHAIADAKLEPVLTDLLYYFERDEARHVGLGVLALPDVLADSRRARGARAVVVPDQDAARDDRERDDAAPAFDTLGIDQAALNVHSFKLSPRDPAPDESGQAGRGADASGIKGLFKMSKKGQDRLQGLLFPTAATPAWQRATARRDDAARHGAPTAGSLRAHLRPEATYAGEVADPHQLREEAASAVARGKFEVALALYGELEQLEPSAAAWPKRVGETHRRMGDAAGAVIAFERAVDKYVHDGLLVQAIAVCKLILQIDPHHASTAVRLSELATPTPAEARAVRGRAPSPMMTTPNGGAESIAMARRAAQAAGDDKPARRVASDPRRDEAPASRAALLDLPLPTAPAEAPVVARVASETAVRPVTPAEVLRRSGNRHPVTLPPGGGLDAIPLALVMPDSQRVVRDDGTDAGMSVLRIDVAFDEVDDEVEIEIVDPRRMALLKTPVFAALPADALEALIGQLELRDLYNGEEVFHEGDTGTTMFVISEGEVEVAAYGQDLATLGPGAFFGEIALVTDLPRSATIRAKGRVELLALDREVVRAAAVTAPEIIGALLHFVRDRLVDRVARTSPLFRPFSEDERALLAARFDVIEVDAGAR